MENGGQDVDDTVFQNNLLWYYRMGLLVPHKEYHKFIGATDAYTDSEKFEKSTHNSLIIANYAKEIQLVS